MGISLISLLYLCYVLLILAQVTYCSLNITSTLLLHIHIAAYTEVSLIASSLSNGLNTTNRNMLFTLNTKVCAFVLAYLFALYALQDLSVPKISLTWWCRPLLKLSPISPHFHLFF